MAAPIDSDTGGVSPFHIPATAGMAVQGRRILKNGNKFAVLDEFGNAQADAPAAEGLFFSDTRHLSRLKITINGMRPLLLSSTVTDGNTVLTVDLNNPESAVSDPRILPGSTIHILHRIVLGQDGLFSSLKVHNYGRGPAELELVIEFDADFVDMFEVRGAVRARRGTQLPVQVNAQGLTFSYRGLDAVRRSTRLAFQPMPQLAVSGRAVWTFVLGPSETWSAQLDVRCERDGLSRDASRSERAECAAGITTDNAEFDDWLRCSRRDLDMLITQTAEGPYPYAGIPWFSTPFGRDGLITAFECLWIDPDLAAGTLRYLAAHQATVLDQKVDAEPGKILHESRIGEMAALGEVPFGRYYGSVDATPLFVMLTSAYYTRTGDRELAELLWPSVEAALSWMSDYGDRDGDSFIEYSRESPNGLDNQGWKDSADAIFHADGTLAEPPIALAEVQGYAYAAYEGAAFLARVLGHLDRADQLSAAADQLKARFEATFWLDDLGVYAPAIDGAKRPCRVIASNAGQALFAGIARPERAAKTCHTLMAARSFSGWGIRTIAEGQPRYNPMSYHNGSVWPHDNAMIGLGFSRYGFKKPLLCLFEGLFDAARGFELKRLPELFCGFARRPDLGPIAYPLACAPQAWSAAAVFALLGSSLGVSFEPEQRRIRFAQPVLPAWLDEIHLTGLRLGSASVDLLVRRTNVGIGIDVKRCEGSIDVAIMH
jgi:glycogen debranching enzyme